MKRFILNIAIALGVLFGASSCDGFLDKLPSLGQAYAIRALCHWDIARLYGYPYMKDNGASLDSRDFAGATRQAIDWNDTRVVLPISHTERLLYLELQQNPGYDE